MSDCGKYPYEDPKALTVPEGSTLTLKQPKYVCRVHGDVSYHTVISHAEGQTTKICVRCIVEKLKELGVCEVTEAQP